MTTFEYKHLDKFLDHAIIPNLHEDCMRAIANNPETDELIKYGFTWYQILDASMPEKPQKGGK